MFVVISHNPFYFYKTSSDIHFLILAVGVFPHFSFVCLNKGLSVWLVFAKNQVSLLFIFFMAFLCSINFHSRLCYFLFSISLFCFLSFSCSFQVEYLIFYLIYFFFYKICIWSYIHFPPSTFLAASRKFWMLFFFIHVIVFIISLVISSLTD